jgi:hypothetical protein
VNHRVRHLVCKDVDGNVVVDTTDISHSPMQDGTAWEWWDKEQENYFEISSPPHSCKYRSYLEPDEPEKKILVEPEKKILVERE